MNIHNKNICHAPNNQCINGDCGKYGCMYVPDDKLTASLKMNEINETKYLHRVIRKLIISNVQRDFEKEQWFLDYGAYRITANISDEKSLYEMISHFMCEIARLDKYSA